MAAKSFFLSRTIVSIGHAGVCQNRLMFGGDVALSK